MPTSPCHDATFVTRHGWLGRPLSHSESKFPRRGSSSHAKLNREVEPSSGVRKRAPNRDRVAKCASIILLALAFGACRGKSGPPDVILITVDTLRADHLGAYGYERPVSPTINSLASHATVFENAVAQAPSTIPSLLQIMSSKYRQGMSISPSDRTLAELFREHGYQTGAVVDNALLELDQQAGGLMRGFATFYRNGVLDPKLAQQHWKTKTPADCITAQAIRWLKRRERERPFFLWLHYFDPHDPYLPPFADDLEALSRGSKSQHTGDIRRTPLFHKRANFPDELSPEDRAHLIALYDAEIRYLDQSLGELFDFLKSERLYDPSVIVLTADHGESFGEHRVWMHGVSLYQPEVHIPLIVKTSRQRRGERVSAPVQAIDAYPTIAAAAGIPIDGLKLDGRDLAERDSGEPAFAFWQRWQLVRTPDWKLVQRKDVVELYRISEDPKELHDLAASQPEVVASLIAARDEKLASLKASQNEMKRLSTGTAERLRALGYFAGD